MIVNQYLDCYIRVSGRSQDTDGHSLDTQRDIGKKVSKRLNLKPRFHDEGVKSSTQKGVDRDQLENIKTGIERGEIKNVWVIEYERLFRKVTDSLLFKEYYLDEYEVNLYSGEEGSLVSFSKEIDNEVYEFRSLISSLESKKIRRRSIRGKRSRLDRESESAPVFLGGTPTFGYVNKNKLWVKEKEESKWVKWMFDSYSNGVSTIEIKKELDRNGVSPRRTKTWGLGTIQKMLRNESYTGLKRFVDKESGQEWVYQIPQTISVSTFQKVQRRLQENKKNQDNNKKHQFLLDRLLYCGCGLKMGCESKTRPHGKTERYYCLSLGRKWRGEKVEDCDNKKSLDKEITDTEIVSLIKGVVTDSVTLKEQFKSEVLSKKFKDDKELKIEKKRLEGKVKKLQRDIERTIENISMVEFERIQGKKDKRVVDKVLKHLDDEKSTLEREYKKTFQDIEDLDSRQEWLDWLGRWGKDFDLKTSTPEKSREYIHGLINKIVCHPVYGENRDRERTLIGQKFDLQFNMRIVKDKLVYRDENQKSLGYEIVEGLNRKKSPVMNVSKGRGKPKKKELNQLGNGRIHNKDRSDIFSHGGIVSNGFKMDRSG